MKNDLKVLIVFLNKIIIHGIQSRIKAESVGYIEKHMLS